MYWASRSPASPCRWRRGAPWPRSARPRCAVISWPRAGTTRRRSSRSDSARARAEGHMKLIVVRGLSGSGKTIALQALEDMGIYCIDNLPFKLLPSLATHLSHAARLQQKIAAVGFDARNLADDFESFPVFLALVCAQGIVCVFVFFFVVVFS